MNMLPYIDAIPTSFIYVGTAPKKIVLPMILVHVNVFAHMLVCIWSMHGLFSSALKKGVSAADSPVLLGSNLKIPVILHTEPFADCGARERCNLVSV